MLYRGGVVLDYLVSHRAELEVIYFISGPLMFLGVVVAWVQLYYIKRDINSKYKRDSIREVFTSCEGLGKANDMSYELSSMLDEEGLLSGCPEIKGFDYSDFEPGCAWLKQFEENKRCYNKSIDFINIIEPISQRILSGLADEKYAYKIEASFFLKIIEEQRAVIAAHRSLDSEDAFKESLELYTLWKNRRKREEARAKLVAEIKDFLRLPKDKATKVIK